MKNNYLVQPDDYQKMVKVELSQAQLKMIANIICRSIEADYKKNESVLSKQQLYIVVEKMIENESK